MIVTAVVCPHPPLLLRELSGAEDAVPELRAACHEALSSALGAEPDVMVVVGGADESREWDPSVPVDVHQFGTSDAPHVTGLPLSLGVASRLLHEVGWAGPTRMHAISWDAGPAEIAALARAIGAVEGRVALVVMGDGAARRGEKAPGHLDERAFAFDDEVGRALEEGDPAALSRLDPVLARELMAFGRAALDALGKAVDMQGAKPHAKVLYRDDPYGVMYHVVVWELP